MLHVELSDREAQALRAVLDSAVGDLGMEIAQTDSQDFRDNLKHDRDALLSLREKLR
jgi:hypothetical protein